MNILYDVAQQHAPYNRFMSFFLPDLVLYRDALILVLNKPTGIPVHKGRGPLTSLDMYFEDLCFGLPQKPELAHRLDKDTSGCLVLGRHKQALKRLGILFQQNHIEKTYHAVVTGILNEKEGSIDLPLAPQSSRKSHWWMKVDHQNGKPSKTTYRVLFEKNGCSYLELKPHTGRTHQLRVHCQALGYPIIGDKIYGEGDSITPLHLHAHAITIPLYPKKEPLQVTAPLPKYMEPWANFESL